MTDKKCPLKYFCVTGNEVVDGLMSGTDRCDGEECAWWDTESASCCVPAFVRRVRTVGVVK